MLEKRGQHLAYEFFLRFKCLGLLITGSSTDVDNRRTHLTGTYLKLRLKAVKSRMHTITHTRTKTHSDSVSQRNNTKCSVEYVIFMITIESGFPQGLMR